MEDTHQGRPVASSIFYPRTVSTPQSIANSACPVGIVPEEYESRFRAANRHFITGANSLCPPNKPVVVPSDDRTHDISINPILACSPEEQKNLFHLSQYAGGAAVMGLAEMLWDTRIPDAIGDLNTFGGNGMGAAVAQSNSVLASINKYDLANKQYQDLKNHRAAPRTVQQAKLRADAAFKEMNHALHSKSLNYLNNNNFGMRPSQNATGRTMWESIPVRDSVDVQKLARFAKIGRVAGPGFILLDGYFRANGVYHSWKNNDPDWERKAVVQGGAFAGGIAAGAAIGVVVAMTPVGLAIGIISAGAVAVGADYAFKEILGGFYDWVSE